MANKKAVDMANLRLAMSENNKKVKECVQSSEKTLQDQVDELKESAVTPEEKASWKNQNAFSAIVVEGTKVEAQDIADTLALTAGDNVSLVPDPNTKQIVIKAEDTKYTHPDSGVAAGTYKNVTVDEQGHVVAGDNPTTLAGYGITDAEKKGTANSAVSAHNTAAEAHSDIRLLITELTNRLNALANSDDETLDQMNEVVAYIKDNRELIESVTTGKVSVADIINNLTSNVSNKPLSAAQGVVLKGLIDALQTSLGTHASDTTAHVTSAERTNWNDANSKKHAHSNKSVLDKITDIDTALSAASENPVQNKVIYAEVDALKKSVSDGKTAVANAITGKGVTTATDATFATMATNIANIDTLPAGTADATATASQILKDKTAYVKGSKVTGTMPNRGTVNATVKCGSGYFIPSGYHSGLGKVTPKPYPNGTEWTKGNISNTTNKTGYSFAHYGNGIWVAGGYNSPLYYSLDGITWTENTAFDVGVITAVYYANGIWLAGSSSDAIGIYYSLDGKTWTQSNITSKYFENFRYGNGIWVAGSYFGGNTSANANYGLAYSLDGKTWTQSNITKGRFRNVYYANGIWVASDGCSDGCGLLYSLDGKTWTQSNVTSSQSPSKFTYAKNLWLVLCGGSNYVLYSTDGKTWTKDNNLTFSTYGLTSNDEMFVIGSSFTLDLETFKSISYGLWYSLDGKTWVQSNITTGVFENIFYDNGIWLAGDRYSLDGKTWTTSNLPGTPKTAFYSKNTNIWVAVIGTYGFYYSKSWALT